ncbi:MAG TPA: hypothetical protein PLK94_01700 [Alphaproteobacteria bacterium]|nr:hypothetical protein [Alphaproteobacteria bacterium]
MEEKKMSENRKLIESNVPLLKKVFGEENWKEKVSNVFQGFEGPSVYFYNECLLARKNEFLGKEHIKMMYACLTAWGMHRMGESSKTKIPPFADFFESIIREKVTYEKYKEQNLLEANKDILEEIWSVGRNIKSSMSSSKLVSVSKTLHFILPELVPPIDRQYTLRFFYQEKEKWVGEDGKYGSLPILSNKKEAQYFFEICMQYQKIWKSNEEELCSVDNPIKTIDNAIMYQVKNQKRITKNPSSAQGSL